MSDVKSIPVPETPHDDDTSESLSPSSGAPGSQREIYQHVSGAGDGHDLETSTLKIDSTMEYIKSGEEPKTTQEDTGYINPRWTRKVKELNDDIMNVLKSIGEDEAEVVIGRKPIRDHKPVTIRWTKAKRQDEADGNETGILLYLAVHTKERARGGAPMDALDGSVKETLVREKSFFREVTKQREEYYDDEANKQRDDADNREYLSSSPEANENGRRAERKRSEKKERKIHDERVLSPERKKSSSPEEKRNQSPDRRKRAKNGATRAKERKGSYETQEHLGAQSEVENSEEEEEYTRRQTEKKKVSWRREVDQKYGDEEDEGKEYDDDGREDDEEDSYTRKILPRLDDADDSPRYYHLFGTRVHVIYNSFNIFLDLKDAIIFHIVIESNSVEFIFRCNEVSLMILCFQIITKIHNPNYVVNDVVRDVQSDF